MPGSNAGFVADFNAQAATRRMLAWVASGAVECGFNRGARREAFAKAARKFAKIQKRRPALNTYIGARRRNLKPVYPLY
jgi:hypothetical protein